MRPESLRLLRQAVRVNPAAKVATIMQEKPRSKDDLAEALIGVHATCIGPGMHGMWTPNSWADMLEELDNDPRTLAEFMDSPEVRALIRAQETPNANA